MTHHATLIRQRDPSSYQPTDAFAQATVRHVFETCGVAEVKQLLAAAYLRPAQGKTQTLVVCAQAITHEAQNALLKLLEEPPVGTHFVLVVPPTLRLLPTLLSRVSVVETGEAASVAAEWEVFLAGSVAARLQQIESWHKDYKKTKDLTFVRTVHAGLLGWLGQSPGSPATAPLQLVAERLLTRGASNKMLLELLALELPSQ